MSHRFRITQAQLDWIWENIPRGLFRITGHGYADIMSDEDAEMFMLVFGVKRHSTLLQRMIEREDYLEKWSNDASR